MIRRVSPEWFDEDAPNGGPRFADRSGWRFECDACGWRSPVMTHLLGAERHEREHDCGEPWWTP